MPPRASDDAINPTYYRSHPSGIETVEIAEHLGFLLGNCFKYVARAGLKGDTEEDLMKAAWYVERLMKTDLHDVDVGRRDKPLVFWTRVQDWIAAEPNQKKRVVLTHAAAAINTRHASAHEFQCALQRLHASVVELVDLARAIKAALR